MVGNPKQACCIQPLPKGCAIASHIPMNQATQKQNRRPAPSPEPPAFSPRLLGPLLKYLEARGVLLSIEAKEAVQQSLGLLIGAAVACVATFAAWLLLVTGVVGLLTELMGWTWIAAVGVTGGVHVLLIAGIGFWMWRRLKVMSWFSHTMEELKHDRLWLRGKTVNV